MDATEAVCPICLASSSLPDGEIGGDNESSSSQSASTTTSAARAIIFVKTPCGHVFCKECIERVALHPRVGGSGIPTRAPCPMCREIISLFDLTYAASNSLVYGAAETDMSSWPVANCWFTQRSMIQIQNAESVLEEMINEKGTIEGYGIEFVFNEPAPSMRFRKPLNMASNCIWDEVQRWRSRAMASSSTSASTLRPCALWDEAGHDDDNHVRALDSIAFDRAHFHAPSMTFRGRISFADPVCDNDEYCYDELDCLLHFAAGGHYVRRGELRWKLASSTPNPNGAVKFPLDGTWEVQYSSGGSTVIHVQKHFFSCFGASYRIALKNDHCPRFTWGDGSVQTSDQQIHPGSSGPGVGETLGWTTTSVHYERIVWKRLATNLDDCWRSFRIVAGNFVYQNCNQHPGSDLSLGPSYHAETLWGNTFCQLYSVGLASYHFLKPDSGGNFSAYISYESPKTEVWPPLDNGERVPPRVSFRNISFDSETRTFRGDVCWEEDYDTTWMGEPKWSYEIVFDPSFTFVASGTCSRSRGETNQFGADLIYINAAVETPLRMALASRSTGEYVNILRQWRNDGATLVTLDKLGEVAMAVMGRRGSMIDFNL